MKVRNIVSSAALILGFGLAFVSPFATADDPQSSFFGCFFECNVVYDQCVEDNGLKMGCGRMYRACIAAC